ncbi:Swarming motility protein SwrB [Bacillus safensis]|uniref:Swarming motility protein SwrB n=1 Tax=Bacillus safensis TaxID=561879 RepID=UPI000DAE562B|nr:Swarming motility protein SwrB [Bacillus safensis]QRF33808.1 Swarming motility protein SwrB [Bacillus safensis]UXO89764.1 Swarming motility protein SwrB [Bacillus safensis]WCL56089.1 Swarming motility protein SwrB [Bacillus safensis]
MLWLISFTLHAALIYFVIILYTRMNSLKATEQKQRELLEETENTLAAFLMEVKEENDKLSKVAAASPDFSAEELKSDLQTPKQPQPPIESQQSVESEDPVPEHLSALLSEVEVQEEKVNEPVPQLDTEVSLPSKSEIEETFEDQVKTLYDEGRSLEEIAKEMKTGKTEIELLLKFSGKL